MPLPAAPSPTPDHPATRPRSAQRRRQTTTAVGPEHPRPELPRATPDDRVEHVRRIADRAAARQRAVEREMDAMRGRARQAPAPAPSHRLALRPPVSTSPIQGNQRSSGGPPEAPPSLLQQAAASAMAVLGTRPMRDGSGKPLAQLQRWSPQFKLAMHRPPLALRGRPADPEASDDDGRPRPPGGDRPPSSHEEPEGLRDHEVAAAQPSPPRGALRPKTAKRLAAGAAGRAGALVAAVWENPDWFIDALDGEGSA